jgi:hypothetical protein
LQCILFVAMPPMNTFAVHQLSMLPGDHQRLCGQGDNSLVTASK